MLQSASNEGSAGVSFAFGEYNVEPGFHLDDRRSWGWG